MRKKLLKQLTMALLLTIAVPTLNAQMAHIGDILCEGDLIVSPANYNANTHTAIGVVFYVDQTGQHGWAIRKFYNSTYCQWATVQQDTPLQNFSNKRQAIYDLDGYSNTQIIRAYSSNYTAFNVVDFANGWYLPAIGQLNYLYGNLVEINASLEIIGGEKFTGSWECWSSTECNYKYAWGMNSSGDLLTYAFVNNYITPTVDIYRRVRAVRNF